MVSIGYLCGRCARKCGFAVMLLACLPVTGNAQSGSLVPQAEKNYAANAQDKLVLAGKRSLSDLRLHISTPRTRYELGERIPITMHYTYDGTRKLEVHAPTYDRSGRIQEFEFTARDANGHKAIDPTPFTIIMGGGISVDPLLSKGHPHEQTVDLNEWLRLDHPDRYTVTLRATTVRFNEPAYRKQYADFPLDSDRLNIEIVPPVDAHRRGRIERARLALDSPEESVQQTAMRDLRCMVDVRAIPLLVRGLESTYGNVQIEATFGLRTFPSMRKVKNELLAALRDPARPLSEQQSYSYPALLAEADVKSEGHTIDKEYGRYSDLFDKWKVTLEQTLTARAKGKPDLFIISYSEELVRHTSALGQSLGDLTAHAGKPNSIAVASDGVLYVVFGEKGIVRKYAPDGKLLREIANPLFIGLTGLACDAKGILYAGEMDTIQRFSPSGADLGVFAKTGLNKALDNVCGMAFDHAGNLYASNFNSSSVHKFSPDGKDLGEFARAGLLTPMGLAFDRNGDLYIADYNKRVIRRYAPDGTDKGDFIHDHLGRPSSLAFDAKGDLFVADGNGVQQFSPQGRYLGEWAGSAGMLANGLAFGTASTQ